MTKWPTHPNGENKKMGEMTPEERRACVKASVSRLKAEFENPKNQEALSRACAETMRKMMA